MRFRSVHRSNEVYCAIEANADYDFPRAFLQLISLHLSVEARDIAENLLIGVCSDAQIDDYVDACVKALEKLSDEVERAADQFGGREVADSIEWKLVKKTVHVCVKGKSGRRETLVCSCRWGWAFR